MLQNNNDHLLLFFASLKEYCEKGFTKVFITGATPVVLLTSGFNIEPNDYEKLRKKHNNFKSVILDKLGKKRNLFLPLGEIK